MPKVRKSGSKWKNHSATQIKPKGGKGIYVEGTTTLAGTVVASTGRIQLGANVKLREGAASTLEVTDAAEAAYGGVRALIFYFGSGGGTLTTSSNNVVVSSNAGQLVDIGANLFVLGQWGGGGGPYAVKPQSGGGGNPNRQGFSLALKPGEATGDGAAGYVSLWVGTTGASGTDERPNAEVLRTRTNGISVGAFLTGSLHDDGNVLTLSHAGGGNPSIVLDGPNARVDVGNAVRLLDGSSGAPSLFFAGHAGTGLWLSSAGYVGVPGLNSSSAVIASAFHVGANQVVGSRGAAVADVSEADATDLASVITLANAIKSRLNTWLARARAATGHGLIA